MLGYSKFAMADVTASPVLGRTWEIKENDLLDVMMARMKEKLGNGGLEKFQAETVRRVKEGVENPEPIEGITRATKSKTTYYDPSVTATENITNLDNQIVVAAGTKVNPLHFIGYSKKLLFIDARDEGQVLFAEAYHKQAKRPVKVVLVAGSYMKLMRQWKRSVYYDQAGTITRKLGITEVPALAWVDPNKPDAMRIDTFPVDKEGNKQ
jgi:conjugal transfer pilus assembly protein TraW